MRRILAEDETTIDAAPAVAWLAVADLAHYPDWWPSSVGGALQDGERSAAGSS